MAGQGGARRGRAGQGGAGLPAWQGGARRGAAWFMDKKYFKLKEGLYHDSK